MLILVLCKKSKISGTWDIWTKQTFYYLFTGRVSDNHRLLLQADSGSSYGFLGFATGHEQRELLIWVYDIAIFLDETFESWKVFSSSSLRLSHLKECIRQAEQHCPTWVSPFWVVFSLCAWEEISPWRRVGTVPEALKYWLYFGWYWIPLLLYLPIMLVYC